MSIIPLQTSKLTYSSCNCKSALRILTQEETKVHFGTEFHLICHFLVRCKKKNTNRWQLCSGGTLKLKHTSTFSQTWPKNVTQRGKQTMVVRKHHSLLRLHTPFGTWCTCSTDRGPQREECPVCVFEQVLYQFTVNWKCFSKGTWTLIECPFKDLSATSQIKE